LPNRVLRAHRACSSRVRGTARSGHSAGQAARLYGRQDARRYRVAVAKAMVNKFRQVREEKLSAED
jgi:hypothetical protein